MVSLSAVFYIYAAFHTVKPLFIPNNEHIYCFIKVA